MTICHAEDCDWNLLVKQRLWILCHFPKETVSPVWSKVNWLFWQSFMKPVKKGPKGYTSDFQSTREKTLKFSEDVTRVVMDWLWRDSKEEKTKKSLRCISSFSTFFFSSSRLPHHCSVTNANRRWLESDQVQIWNRCKYQPIIYQKSPIKYHGLFTMEPIIHQCLLKSIQ